MRQNVCRKRSAPRASKWSRTVTMQASGRLVSSIPGPPSFILCGKDDLLR